MDFEIILACDSKNGIALESSDNVTSISSIPWKIAEDMKFFRETTARMGDNFDNSRDITRKNVIIMGRKTADTFKNPLPNRINVIITRQKDFRINEGFISFSTLSDALNNLKTNVVANKVFVIGGAQLVNEAIFSKYCRAVNLNIITHNYNCNIVLSNEFMNEINSSKYEKCESKKIVFCKSINKHVELTYTRYEYINYEEIQYLNIAKKILEKGHYRMTRNAYTYSLFGERLEFDLSNGFPLLTTKKMFTRGIFEELLFFLRGDTNTKNLKDKNVNIWNGNTSKEFIEQNNKKLEEFDMGPMYGFQWRHYNAPYEGCKSDYNGKGIDQLKNVIDLLLNDPYSRRILLTTYNPTQSDEGVLFPCHGLTIQFYVEENNRISLQMYQRSCDWALGVPFNIASYAALLHIIVNIVNNNENINNKIYTAGRLIIVFGDVHIYSDEKSDHIEPIKKQLKRKSRSFRFPDFKINKKIKSLDDLNNLQVSDLEVTGYRCDDSISIDMIP